MFKDLHFRTVDVVVFKCILIRTAVTSQIGLSEEVNGTDPQPTVKCAGQEIHRSFAERGIENEMKNLFCYTSVSKYIFSLSCGLQQLLPYQPGRLRWESEHWVGTLRGLDLDIPITVTEEQRHIRHVISASR